MRRAAGLAVLAVILGLAPSVWPPPAAAEAPAEGCIACHLDLGDERLVRPAKELRDDIHAAKGFGCVACHGGDAKESGMEAMDPGRGYIGKPDRRAIPPLCGRCHSDALFMKRYNPSLRVDQVAEYQTSVHGRRLQRLSDPKVATCTSCHPAHQIRPPSDPKSSVHPVRVAETCGGCHGDAKYMEPYRIPTDQVQRYQGSVHWATLSRKGDLSAPTCNDCHGNHGAAPPGIGWVGNVCGQCHAVMADLFSKSTHARVFTQMGAPGCATCHDNHEVKPAGDELLGLGEGAACVACHAAADKGGQAAVAMRGQLDRLRTEAESARAILLRAEQAGMEVSQAQFELNGATDALIKARAAVHAFAPEAVRKEAEPGLAVSAKAYARGVRALEELQFRRKGLAVSVVIILALIGGLVLKIRQLDRSRAGREPSGQEEA